MKTPRRTFSKSILLAALVLVLLPCASAAALVAQNEHGLLAAIQTFASENLQTASDTTGATSLSTQAVELVNTAYKNVNNTGDGNKMMPVLAARINPEPGNNTTFINREWYVVDKDLSMEGRLEVYGKNVNIIIADGVTFTVHGGIFIREREGLSQSNEPVKLTIWGQHQGSGTLNAGATWSTDESMTAELRAGQKAGRAGAGIGAIPSQAGGDLVINGCNINACGYEKSAGIGGSYRFPMRSVTINAGTVNARPGSMLGKEFEGGCGIGSGIYSAGFPITINGGTVRAQGGAASAGIGGAMASSQASHGDNTYAGPITINGGTVTALGGPKGAGIGSGWLLPSKSITITGGTVTAAGYDGGAGIGGGNNEDGQGGRNWPAADQIKITGGTVKAYAYITRPTLDHTKDDFGLAPMNRLPKTPDAAGAGIGAGQHAHSGPIIIEGGDIFAWSSAWAAGIGGGSRGDFDATLTVSGGKVVAIGGTGAAGIGGGFAGNQNASIYIRGGEVYAYAGVDWQRDYNNSTHGAAGIGGGKEDWYNTGGCAGGVFIEGDSKVVACGGSSFPVAIGIGYNETKELGSLSIADNMWVRWCAGCDLTKYNTEAGDQWLGMQREPASPDKLHASNAATRVSDCKHMTYVLIEKCPHTGASYTDINEDDHLLSGTCTHCNGLINSSYEHHDFNSGTEGHTCVCGHKEYEVAFLDEDGTALKDTEWYVGGVDATSIAKPADPTKEGYTFAGWYLKNGDAYEDEPYNFNGTIDRNLTLYAKWTEAAPATHTVSFYDHDGAAVQQSVSVETGKRVAASDIPTPDARTDETFNGWYEKSGTEFAPETFDFSQPITKDVNLYQKWTAKPVTHTVIFHPENGEADTRVSVQNNELVSPAATPVNGTKRFAGWYEKDGDEYFANPFSFATPITANKDLYALWEAPVHLVSFDARDGVFPDEAFVGEDAFDNPNWTRKAVKDGEKLTELVYAPSREGYDFNGWYLSGEPYNFNDPVTSDITLVAQWGKTGEASSYTAPVPLENLTYSGESQTLVQGGTAEGGTMLYALGTDMSPTTDASPSVPAAVNAGTYYVWYGVEGDETHADTEMDYVIATIAKAAIEPQVSIDSWTAGQAPSTPVMGDDSNPGAANVTFEYAQQGSDTWSQTPPQTAGAYLLRATVEESLNYQGGTATATFTVAPAPEPDPEPTPSSKGLAMYRLYNPNSGEHFYTANAGERDATVKAGWRYEGVGWTAPKTEGEPVYRLYNPNVGDHHYTVSIGERNALVSVGWRYEGVGWLSDSHRSVAVYREYNPYARCGAHNFTTSQGEHLTLCSLGWRGEGIAWYGI